LVPPARILIVDDEPFNRDVLIQELELLDHEGLTAIHGRDALDQLSCDTVNLILLDIMMPEMEGFEVLRRLKDGARLRHIPVIMISALDDLDSVGALHRPRRRGPPAQVVNPVLLKARIGACLENKRWHDQEVAYLERIEREKAKHEALLRNILPGDIVTRLNGGEVVIADRVEEATILFADLVGFSAIAAQVTPAALVDNLKRIFSTFDALCQRFGIERIKTIGDAYMAAAGLPEPRPDHAEADAEFALTMLAALDEVNAAAEVHFDIRIGIHTGPVIVGVIGPRRFLYDIWGDTVNLASRLESHGMPGRIHVSERTSRMLRHSYEFLARDLIDVKGIGQIRTAFLTGRSGSARTGPLAGILTRLEPKGGKPCGENRWWRVQLPASPYWGRRWRSRYRVCQRTWPDPVGICRAIRRSPWSRLPTASTTRST
jgi:adenylate cyclase